MQAQADHAWRYWWRQGSFGLLEAAARRHAREQRARGLELAKGQRVRFLWRVLVCAAEWRQRLSCAGATLLSSSCARGGCRW